MGARSTQDGKIVSTFSCKFNVAQLKYTVTGQELLAAVKACKHFDQISIWGCKIWIHTYHKNLTHDSTVHVNLRDQRAWIVLDSDYVPEFVHIAGEDNTAADSPSRLEMVDNETTEIAKDIFAILNNNLNREKNTDFPLDTRQIMNTQKNN